MEIIEIDPACIEVGKRLRAVDPDRVAFLVETIGRRGLDTPVQVTVPDANGFCRLLAGAHRLAAVRQLNLPTIPAIPRAGSDLELKLIEIEENLVRHELTELDRATFLAEHQTVYLQLYPSTKPGGDRRKKSNPQVADLIPHPLVERFSAYTARKLGVSEDTIHRAIRRAKLPESVRDRIAGSWMADNGSALDALIGPKGTERTEDEQHDLLDILLATEGGTRNFGEALRRLQKLPPRDPAEKLLERLSLAWEKAPLRIREEMLRSRIVGSSDQHLATRRMIARLLAEAQGDAQRGEDRVVGALGQGRPN